MLDKYSLFFSGIFMYIYLMYLFQYRPHFSRDHFQRMLSIYNSVRVTGPSVQESAVTSYWSPNDSSQSWEPASPDSIELGGGAPGRSHSLPCVLEVGHVEGKNGL